MHDQGAKHYLRVGKLQEKFLELSDHIPNRKKMCTGSHTGLSNLSGIA